MSTKDEDFKILSSIINAEEICELITLLTDITLLMRKQLSDIFAPPAIGQSSRNFLPLETVTAEHTKDDFSSKIREDSEIKEKFKETKATFYPSENKLSTPKRQKLEQDCFEFFDKWRESVLSHVYKAIEVPGRVKEHQKDMKFSKRIPRIENSSETVIIKLDSRKFAANTTNSKLNPPISTSLSSLPQENRVLIFHSVLLILLSLEKYMAPSRILLINLTSALHLPLDILVKDEIKVAQSLLGAVEHISGAEETEKRGRENLISRIWKAGLAGVAGAAVIGITGGLAAPLVAGAIGTIMGGLGLGATAVAGLLGSLAQSSVLVGSLFGAYGARMTSRAIDSYAKEVQDFSFLPMKSSNGQEIPQKDHRLRVTIGVSGWLTHKEDVTNPWRALGQESEVFALRWELEALTNLGQSLESVAKSTAWKIAKKEIISRTIFSSLLLALWPISLLSLSKIVDNPFSICMSRADKAGTILADAIINKSQGERPVTLIGYSLGARLIYSCLMSLAERRAFGLIEGVVLMGAPIPSNAAVWLSLRSVVSGRLVNVFSTNDYILAFLYRTYSVQYGVAGLQSITDVNRVENIDVSEIVSGHLRYQLAVGSILEKIGWENIYLEVVAIEEKTLAMLKEKENNEEQKRGEKIVSEDESLQAKSDTQKVEASHFESRESKSIAR
ncbi:putative membrane protein C6F6.13c [Golovinomyces cichoracearum]|uniref:Putative membrane protein C6F6.13c n=1 Tax=Golovinomyces cichoracearum TaxID=62708 RepID=A0A420IVH6_9PEZI|nr:putative membrane protein C6F6.13c [Golovinomyces cichoracearum]